MFVVVCAFALLSYLILREFLICQKCLLSAFQYFKFFVTIRSLSQTVIKIFSHSLQSKHRQFNSPVLLKISPAKHNGAKC